MYSGRNTSKEVGFPIQKSSDQRVLAPPRSLSQPITSFIACICQGIHQMPFSYLSSIYDNLNHNAYRAKAARYAAKFFINKFDNINPCLNERHSG